MICFGLTPRKYGRALPWNSLEMLQPMGMQLEARERQLAAARQELQDMEEGFHGNKRLLQQSGEERRSLAASESALQEQLRQARAEAQQAQRENARHAADAAVARADMQRSTIVSPPASQEDFHAGNSSCALLQYSPPCFTPTHAHAYKGRLQFQPGASQHQHLQV